jgi:hypothetical protein
MSVIVEGRAGHQDNLDVGGLQGFDHLFQALVELGGIGKRIEEWLFDS